ncbi:MAG: hypothetical protein PUE25_02470 [bacterium]|nr:hypothetical protein [bacterium]
MANSLMAFVWHFFFAFMAAGGMGFDGVWMDGREQKAASPKKTAAIEAIEEMVLRGVWRGQGLFMVRHLEMAVCFAIMWWWQNGGGWWIFWKNAKIRGGYVDFFCIFCNFA